MKKRVFGITLFFIIAIVIVTTIVIVLGNYQEDFPDYEYSDEISKIRERIYPVDSMQKFFYKNGDVDKSISIIEIMDTFAIFDNCFVPTMGNIRPVSDAVGD